MQWAWAVSLSSVPLCLLVCPTSAAAESGCFWEEQATSATSQGLLQAQAELNRTWTVESDSAEPAHGASKAWLALADSVRHSPLPSRTGEYISAAVGLFLMLYLAFYLKFLVEEYEEKATLKSPPWFCDGPLILQVGGGVILAWTGIGLIAFMSLFDMAVLGETRKLTLAESLYLCAEIITTVGYGDLAPASLASQVFVAAYSVLGCSIIAVVFSLLFNFCLGNQRQLTPSLAHSAAAAAAARCKPSRQRYATAKKTLWPLLTALLMGTVFFAYYPGEEKTHWEAFYFSLQTLTTVGFGDVYPVTPGGRAFATVWMLLGVTSAANAIVTMTDAILKYRKELKADHLSKELLSQMSMDGSGKVHKLDFLCYELIRRGLCENDDVSDILALFSQLDSKGAGFLNAQDVAARSVMRSH